MHPRNYSPVFLALVLAFAIGFAAQSAPLQAQAAVCVKNADCGAGSFCQFPAGTCPADGSGKTGSCVATPENCTQQDDPVCGCDNKTYSNDCIRQMAGVSQKSTGACVQTGSKAESNPDLDVFLRSLR